MKMIKPSREEMIEGIALGVQRFLSLHYSAPYLSVSEDMKKAMEDGTRHFLNENKHLLEKIDG